MKNWGQKTRTIKIKKRYTLSPFVLNLTEEARSIEALYNFNTKAKNQIMLKIN